MVWPHSRTVISPPGTCQNLHPASFPSTVISTTAGSTVPYGPSNRLASTIAWTSWRTFSCPWPHSELKVWSIEANRVIQGVECMSSRRWRSFPGAAVHSLCRGYKRLQFVFCFSEIFPYSPDHQTLKNCIDVPTLWSGYVTNIKTGSSTGAKQGILFYFTLSNCSQPPAHPFLLFFFDFTLRGTLVGCPSVWFLCMLCFIKHLHNSVWVKTSWLLLTPCQFLCNYEPLGSRR